MEVVQVEQNELEPTALAFAFALALYFKKKIYFILVDLPLRFENSLTALLSVCNCSKLSSSLSYSLRDDISILVWTIVHWVLNFEFFDFINIHFF